MAGETEDCIRIQAECMPTGSISFGRFELESLSWERRSSFSHNRYLEEVEKFSTPGSVTQKRAILEAHFRKKPLSSPCSSDNRSAEPSPTAADPAAGNYLNHQASSSNKFEGHDDRREAEFSGYNDMPGDSDEHEEGFEQRETWSSEMATESNNCEVAELTYDLSDHDEIVEVTEDYVQPSNDDDLFVVTDQEPDNKSVIVEELLDRRGTVVMEEVLENKEAIVVEEVKRDVPSKRPVVEKKRVPTLKNKTQDPQLKVKEVEKKTAKTKHMDQLPLHQSLKKSSFRSSSVSSGNMLSRSMGKLEKDSTLRRKQANQLPSGTSVQQSSDCKNKKSEASDAIKPKSSQGNRRTELNYQKEGRARKNTITTHSISGKAGTDIRPPSRSKQAMNYAKEEAKQNGVVFSFKSDERAEKRREYFMKLEEKLHAKEAEMNKIQARVQEEKDAAMRQFRRSLNFKATPMPSFYHEPKASETRKVATPAKPLKLPSKCTSSWGSQTCPRERSTMLSKSSNGDNLSSDRPNTATRSVNPSESRAKDEKRRNSRENKSETANRRTRATVSNVLKDGIRGGSVPVHVVS